MNSNAVMKIERSTWYRCPECRTDYTDEPSAQTCYGKHLSAFREIELCVTVGEWIEYRRDLGSDNGGAPYTALTDAKIVALDGECWDQRALVERETGEREWIRCYQEFMDGLHCVIKKVRAA